MTLDDFLNATAAERPLLLQRMRAAFKMMPPGGTLYLHPDNLPLLEKLCPRPQEGKRLWGIPVKTEELLPTLVAGVPAAFFVPDDPFAQCHAPD